MYYVYRYMMGNKWIYVGKADASNTKNELHLRIKCHSKDERFLKYEQLKISYCVLNSKSDMNAVESMLIKIKHPEINVIDRTNYELPFVLDNKKIKWIPIEEYTYINTKQSFPNIIDDKLLSFIKQKFADSNPTWYDTDFFPKYFPRDSLAFQMATLLKERLESDTSLCFPMCESSFEVNISDISDYCEYNRVVKPQTFSRLIKESVKRIKKQYDIGDEWWSIDCRRDGIKMKFHVLHGYKAIRDYTNSFISMLDDIPLCLKRGV